MATVDVSRYVDLPYSLEVRLEVDDEGDQFYTATHLELLGCRSQGATPEEAVALLREAREMYLSALVEAGVEVPHPLVFRAQRRAVPLFSVDDYQVDTAAGKKAVHTSPEATATPYGVEMNALYRALVSR